jgi:tetraacyldisaccharide 4'-kinase
MPPVAHPRASSSAVESTLTAAWQKRGGLAMLLWPLSLLTRAVAGIRRKLYLAGWLASTRLPVPVIVVGNIFIGGTGKTPLVIWLVGLLQAAGYTPGVISRGYGRNTNEQGRREPKAVTATSPASVAGDEPLLIAQRTGVPVVVNPKRVAAARKLLDLHPETDVIISDDGLQHYALARDIEIVLFDSRGVGNGWMLPAGPLREPVSRPRDFTVHNATTLPNDAPAGACTMQLAGDVAHHLADCTRSMPLAALKGAPRVAAAAGIGNPQRFFRMLTDAGIDIHEIPLPDHYDYSANPFAGLEADVILITEKDAVKCRQHPVLRHDARLWFVPVTAQIDSALGHQLLEKLRGFPTA